MTFVSLVTSGLIAVGTQELNICLVKKWPPTIPDPEEAVLSSCFTVKTCGRQLQLHGFVAVALGEHRNALANEWLLALQALLHWPDPPDTCVDVVDTLLKAINNKKLLPLVAQLIWAIARMFERVAGQEATDKRKLTPTEFSFTLG